MAGEMLTIYPYSPIPEDNTPISADGTDGTWTAGTYSFLVVAWFSAAETDRDFAGWFDGGQPNWNNLTVQNAQTVRMNWAAADKVPDHYTVYYQAASAYNCSNPGTKIAEYAGTATSADIAGPGAGGTTLIFTTMAGTVINPVIDLPPNYEDRILRGYDGKLIIASSSRSTDLDEIVITAVMSSITTANYRRLMKLLENHIRVRVVETGTDDNNPYYDVYVGYLHLLDKLLTWSKTRTPEFNLRLKVESVTADPT